MKLNTYDDIEKNFKINKTSTTGDPSGPGFHGDIRLIELTDNLLKKSTNFIETGTNMGNTLYFVSRNYDIECFSCEVHTNTPQEVLYTTKDNIYFSNTGSPEFLKEVVALMKLKDSNSLDEVCFFWLDAHTRGGETIYLSEIDYIINNFKKYYIFIDDVDINVNGWNHNGYGLSEIKNVMKDNKLYIPDYNELENPFHGKTGWALVSNLDLEKINIKEI